MRLGFVSDFYAPSIGGTQILAQSLCEGFADLSHEVEVITTPDSSREHSNYSYKIHEVKGLNFTNSDFFLVQNYDAVLVLADLFSPTLQTINPGDTRKSILILNLDENVYRWIHEGRIPNVQQIVEKIKLYTHVVSFCKGAPVNKFLEENGIEHSFIPNFTRDTQITQKPPIHIRNALKLGNKKIIFNHGLIEDRKNQLSLIQSFAASGLREDHTLVLLGSPRSASDNAYLSQINSMIEEQGLSECVKMVKGTNNRGLIDLLLCSSDIYVLPSKAEGLPLVLLEAMSAGLPWISTPVGGVPEVFGSLQGGVVLPQIAFTSEELESAVRSVERGHSRREWSENFTKEKALERYSSLLNVEEDYIEAIHYLQQHRISFGNQVYNEPEAIENYLSSCLQFAGIVDEVFIINHRSSDNTLDVIESFKERYDNAGIQLRWRTEERDLSKNFTIADVFGAAVQECNNEIVFRHDADFVFGKGYLKTMVSAIKSLADERVYACGYEIPVVSENLTLKDNKIINHGFCNMHVAVPRVFKKSKTICLQNHVGGKYEWFYPVEPDCSHWAILSFNRESLLSVNIKSVERQQVRETMNTFMEDVQTGKVDGEWIGNDSLRRETEEQNKKDTKLKKSSVIGETYAF